MYTQLIEFLKAVRQDEIDRIDLEEIALIQASRCSWPADSSGAAKLAFISDLVENWLKLYFKSLTPAFNMRMQPLLRDTLNAIIKKGVKALNPSQTRYLITVSHILDNIKGTDKDNRLLQLLRQHKDALQSKLTGEEVGRLPDLLGTFRFTTANEIQKSPRHETDTFGGIDLSLNAPMMKHKGNIKVLDSIPDDTMLNVEGGSCYVSGYVMGHVSTTEGCEVRENISGTVIAAKGDIHVRNILMKACVISKWNNVTAENTQDPELVFAGNKIHIHGKALLGTYAAPTIQVDGEISGGELSFSESCKAPKFACSQSRNLLLEMQEKISCDVYGGLVDPEAGRIIAAINKIKARHSHVTKMIKVIHTECEHYASNGIMYLLGGDLVQKKIEEISRKQRRIAFLERILNGIDAITQSTRMQLIQQQRRHARIQSDAHAVGGMDELNEDLGNIKDDADVDSDLSKEGQELYGMTLAISARAPIDFTAPHQLDSKKRRWLAEKAKAHKELDQSEKIIRKSVAQNEVMKSQPDSASKIQILNLLIQNTKGKPNHDPVLQRSRSNFIQLIVRTIEQRKHRMLKYRDLLGRLSQEHDQLRDKLKKTHNLDPPAEQDETSAPVAKGVFDQNVIICTDKFLIDASRTECHGLHLTTQSASVRIYTVRDNKIAQIEWRPQ